MSNGSTISLVGNLTRDPEEKAISNGGSLAQFSVASSRRWKDKDGEWQEETSYFDVTAWSDLAKNVMRSLSKGSRVVVIGRLEQQSWEDRKTGDKRSKVVVIAEDIGPSLRNAYTPEIVKSNDKGNSYAGKSNSYAKSAPSQPVLDDEEPF